MRTRGESPGRGGHLGLAGLLAPLALLLACAPPAEAPPPARPEPPRLEASAELDPLVVASVEEGRERCRRGVPGAWVDLGLRCEANRLEQKAVEAYDACLALPELRGPYSEAEVQFHRGRALAECEAPERAEAAFSASVALEPGYVPAHWRLGRIQLELGRPDAARTSFERALALEPTCVPARIGLARVLLLEDRPAQAIAMLEPVLERQPKERLAHGLMARAYQASGDAERAERERALDKRSRVVTTVDPLTDRMRTFKTSIVSALRRAKKASHTGRPMQAVKILSTVYDKVPGNLAVLQVLVKAQLDVGQVARARTLVEQGLELYPDDYKLTLLESLVLQAEGRLEPALERAQHALELHPDYGPTQIVLGEVLLALGRNAEAERALLVGVRSREAEESTSLNLARAQMAQEAFDRAELTLRHALEASPRSSAPWLALAEVLARTGRADEARAAVAQAETRGATQRQLEALRGLLASTEGH